MSRVGIPIAELELVERVEDWIGKLLPTQANADSFILREFGTDHGLADLVCVVMPRPWLRARESVRVPPVTGRTKATLLAAFGGRRLLRMETLAKRSGLSGKSLRSLVSELLRLGAVSRAGENLRIRSVFLDRPIETVSVEAKTSDWRRGLQQALSYSVFAHRSYLAVPSPLTSGLHRDQPMFAANGIGVIAIPESGTPVVVSRARKRRGVSPIHHVMLTELLYQRFRVRG